MDGAKVALRELGEALGSYRRQLRAQGFTRRETFTLVRDYAVKMLNG